MTLKEKEKQGFFYKGFSKVCSMTKTEIMKWIKEAKYVITNCCISTLNGHNYTKDIFEKNGIYYSIEYIDGKVISNIRFNKEGKAVKSGKFTPKKVNVEDFGEMVLTRDK